MAPIPAFGAGEQEPGRQFSVSVDSLPEPFATPSSVNFPYQIARPADAGLRVPQGFTATIFADGLSHPRWMGVAENGDVFLAESSAGKVTLLRDSDGDGKAELVAMFAEGFERPHGIAFAADAVYIADVRAVWRLSYTPGALKPGDRAPVTRPGALGRTIGNHWTRNLVFDSKGRMFVAVGSRGNVAEEPPPHASVQRFDADGKAAAVATGLRNPVGIAFYPGTDDLYVVVNERDGLGDGLVPDYLTRVEEGAFYGWPYAYLGAHPDPDWGAKKPDMVARAKAPDLLFEAHSAPIGLVFYDADQFPQDYRGDAFVALRGSWNSGRPTGYKVVRVKFAEGRPAGGYENFATGFWLDGEDRAGVWGRPAGLAVAGDGSLLIADDTGKSVWRVAYRGK